MFEGAKRPRGIGARVCLRDWGSLFEGAKRPRGIGARVCLRESNKYNKSWVRIVVLITVIFWEVIGTRSWFGSVCYPHIPFCGR